MPPKVLSKRTDRLGWTLRTSGLRIKVVMQTAGIKYAGIFVLRLPFQMITTIIFVQNRNQIVYTVYWEMLCNWLLARCLTEVSLGWREESLAGLMVEKKGYCLPKMVLLGSVSDRKSEGFRTANYTNTRKVWLSVSSCIQRRAVNSSLRVCSSVAL